jgi:dihydropteroate synthase
MQNVDAAGLGIGDDHPTRIMGVLNVSAESPYDPSVFDDPAEAAAYVEDELVAEGADIVDIGLESANKRFEVLSAEEELERLGVALSVIENTSADPVWSIETRYHEVAAAALDGGFDMINDIAGFADPEMPRVAEEYGVAVAKMASPPDLTRPGAVEETPWAERKGEDWADQADYVDMVYEALKQNGLPDDTIVDPAFGGWSEAKTVADDRETFRRLREFRGLGRPMLVSINRKNFLRSLTGRSTEDALAVSLAATSTAIERGAHVIRTHDVRETVDAAAVGDAFMPERHRSHADGVAVEELDVRSEADVRRHADRLGTADLAATATLAVFDVRGLPQGACEELGTLATDAETTFATNAAGDGGLLVGTHAALDTLVGTAPATTGAATVLDAVASALE